MADGMTSSEAAALYERDFLDWTRDQAAALRAAAGGRAARLDLLNLAEEIESLGLRDERELRSRIATILEHLLKLERSPAADSRAGWHGTVRRERREVEGLLRDSPSLRRLVPEMIAEEGAFVAGIVGRLLRERGEEVPGPARAALTPDQVLGDWWPDLP